MHKLAPKFHSVVVVATLVYITAQLEPASYRNNKIPQTSIRC